MADGGTGLDITDDVAIRLLSDAAREEAIRHDGRHFFDDKSSAIVFLESPAIRSGWVRWCLERDDRIRLEALGTVHAHFPSYATRTDIASQSPWRELIEEFAVAQQRRADGDPDLIVEVLGSHDRGVRGVVEAVTADGEHHLVSAESLAAAESPRSRFCRDLSRCTVVQAPPEYPGGCSPQRRAPTPNAMPLSDPADAVSARHEIVHVAHRGLVDALELLTGVDDGVGASDAANVRITVWRTGQTAEAGGPAVSSARVRLEARGRRLPAGEARLLGGQDNGAGLLADVVVSISALRAALTGGAQHVLHFRDDGRLRIESWCAEPHSAVIDTLDGGTADSPLTTLANGDGVVSGGPDVVEDVDDATLSL